jgi:hypothetical protein
MITTARIAMVWIVCEAALGQSAAPKFADYPATEAYSGKNAPGVITANDRQFQTRLRQAATKRPNFARHYILTSWGCGSTCMGGL